MTTPAERLAELDASTEVPSIDEYAQATAATFPPLTEAPEEARLILRSAHAQAITRTTKKSA